jgi:HEAT repeat protein
LIRIYEQNISPASQFYVSRALIAIGPDATRTAIPAFLRGAANSNLLVRKFAVRALAQVHDEPSLVVPALAKSLSDTNVAIRASAAWGLGGFGREVRQAVPLAGPVLIKALGDPDGSVRGSAACSLKAFGAEAKQAVPALLELLKDEDEYARGAAAEALGQIDPEAAAKAGVK